MLTYIIVNISLVFLGLFYELLNYLSVRKQGKRMPVYLFAIPSFFMLFIISSFRGDFTSDYNSYAQVFTLYNQYAILDIFKVEFYQEKGYVFLNLLIGLFTEDPTFLFMIVTFIILTCFYSQFKRHSPYIWLSVLMFVNIGAYYTSFNIMRHILAVAITFAGAKYLYERKMIKYFLVVFVASLFHKTSLIMIIFYFILNLKLKPKNIVILFFASVLSYFYLGHLMAFIQRFFYTGYNYGMGEASINNIILPFSLLIFSLFHRKKIDFDNNMYRIWMNAVIFYALFSAFGLSIQMLQRFAEYFAPFLLLLIPLIVSKMKFDYLKLIQLSTLVLLLVLYSYIVYSGTGYDPYYFIWDRN